MKLTVSSGAIRKALKVPALKLPTYLSPLLNLANRFARGTVPEVVGQMSDLIQEFDGKTLDEWAKWYEEKNPEAIQEATKLIKAKLNEYKNVIESATDEEIKSWVRDLVISKTFIGLRAQEAIIQRVADELGLKYRLAKPDEEAKGIDGVIGKTPVSVKPASYKSQVIQKDTLPYALIYYDKDENGKLTVEFDEKRIS